jgi:hypothetical protein
LNDDPLVTPVDAAAYMVVYPAGYVAGYAAVNYV